MCTLYALTAGFIATLLGLPSHAALIIPNTPLQSATLIWSNVGTTDQYAIARRNPPIFFRRALKITNGALGNLVAPGLTIASENPTYLQGNWNANSSGFGNPLRSRVQLFAFSASSCRYR